VVVEEALVEEEASMVVVVVLLVAVSTVEEEAEVEVQGLAGGTSLVEEDSVLLDQDSVVVPRTTMAEGCVPLIRAPGSFVLPVVDRPRLPDRIAG
jgi:hypothetical protein